MKIDCLKPYDNQGVYGRKYQHVSCIQYIFFRTGYRMDGFYGTGNRKINVIMKPLQVLLDYIRTGTIKFKMRPKIQDYQCPTQFEEEYSAFQEELIYRKYSRATIISTTMENPFNLRGTEFKIAIFLIRSQHTDCT